MKRLIGLIGIIVFIIGAVTPVAAQVNDEPEALNLTTSPLPITLDAKPGDTVKTQLRIKNSGAKAEVLKVGLMKFIAFGDEGKPQLQERMNGDDYFDWVTFSEDQFTAEPNEWKELTMTIALPKTAAFGYYYAVTFSRANTNVPTDAKTAVIRGGTATLVLLEANVPGAKRQLELEDFHVSKKSYEFLPVSFSIKLKNTGNVHTVPSGTIFITKGGKQVDSIVVNSSRGNMLPGSSRIYESDWENGFPVYKIKNQDNQVVLKDGRPVHELKWNLNEVSKLRWGKYTAHLTVVYDDGERDVPLDASVDFWVIPWRLIAIFVGLPGLLIGLIIYLYISRRRYKHKRYNGGFKP